MSFIVYDQIEIKWSKLFAVATVCHERLDRCHNYRRTDHLSRTPGVLVNDRLIFAKDNVEILHRLLRELYAIDNEKDAFSVPRNKKSADQCSAKQCLAGASRHFKEKLASPL